MLARIHIVPCFVTKCCQMCLITKKDTWRKQTLAKAMAFLAMLKSWTNNLFICTVIGFSPEWVLSYPMLHPWTSENCASSFLLYCWQIDKLSLPICFYLKTLANEKQFRTRHFWREGSGVVEIHSLRLICRDILRGVVWNITLCDGWKGKRNLLTFVLHLMKLLSRMGLQDFC